MEDLTNNRDVNPEDNELYDDGGHVKPEVLANMIDRAKDEADDKYLNVDIASDIFDHTEESTASKMDDDSDKKEDNGNLPPGVEQKDLDFKNN